MNEINIANVDGETAILEFNKKQSRQQLKIQCLAMAIDIFRNETPVDATTIVDKAKDFYKFARS